MPEFERRFVPMEFRLEPAKENEGLPMIRGYAAVFNSWSQDLGGFREMIHPGAFARSLSDPLNDFIAAYNHDPNQLLGRRSSGTLTATEDARGLAVEIQPPNTSTGRDVVELIKRGDLKGMSFAFTLPNPKTDQTWKRSEDGDLRELHRVNLHDVSVVTEPAYPDTSVGTRSLNEWLGSLATETRTRRVHLASRELELLDLQLKG